MQFVTSRRAVLALSAMAFAPHALASTRSRLFVDGLSFLPDDLHDVDRSGISAMICDISEVDHVRDADGTPRYPRTYARNAAALEAAVARLKNSPSAYVALRGSDIGKQPGCATFLQMQSAEPIGTDLSRLSTFHDKGLRVLQFTHHNNTAFAGGALEVTPTGLTPLGRDGLRELNRLRMLPDVSHGSEATMLEAAALSTTPIVYSHGACRAIVDNPRCITDAAIRAIAKRGGVIGIFMMSFWLTQDPVPTPEHWVRHVRHVINTGGIGAVGVANDFPFAGQTNLVKLGNDNAKGVVEYLEWWRAMNALGLPGFARDPEHVVIPAFNAIDRMFVIERTLERARFKPREIDGIMGGNLRRVLTDALG